MGMANINLPSSELKQANEEEVFYLDQLFTILSNNYFMCATQKNRKFKPILIRSRKAQTILSLLRVPYPEKETF